MRARRGSGGQEGGWVVWGNGLGAEGDEVGVVGGGEGVDGHADLAVTSCVEMWKTSRPCCLLVPCVSFTIFVCRATMVIIVSNQDIAT